MGFKIKSLVSKAIPAVSSAVGAYLGGTSGAGTGYQVGNMISGAVGLGGDGVDSTDKAYARYQMRLQQEMSDYAFNQNLQMWNLNNAYNDPSAQMARLEKAGLNKNLVYGGGNVTGNTSGGTPNYESGSIGMVDKRTQRAQIALAMEEHQQRITNQAIENELARERIGLAQREADRQDKLADAQIKAYAANLGLTDARIGDIYYNQNERPSSEIGRTFRDIKNGVKNLFTSKSYKKPKGYVSKPGVPDLF